MSIAADDRDKSSLFQGLNRDVMSPGLLARIPVMNRAESELVRQYIGRTAELRVARGMTQQEMADALNIPLERYKKYEQRSAMPVYLVARFAAIVGRDIEFVIAGKSSRRRGPRASRGADM